MKMSFILSLLFSILLTACGNSHDTTMDEHDHAADRIPPIPFTTFNPGDAADINKVYVPTGFYFLTESDGVKMVKDRSNEVYNLNRLPFVSVQNISGIKLEKAALEGGMATSVIMTFDKDGTHSLEEGTGNPIYPYLAVVIANRLLYVVKNVSKIKTGVMEIYLVGYTEAQINEMTEAINQKK